MLPIRFYFLLSLVFLCGIASAQELDYQLVNTLEGIRIEFNNRNGLSSEITFSISGSNNVHAKVSNFSSLKPIIEASNIVSKTTNQRFQFKHGENYVFIINGVTKNKQYIRPKKYIYTIGIDNPINNGDGYNKLDSAYIHSSDFHTIASTKLFPQYSDGKFIAPSERGTDHNTVLKEFDILKSNINDNDIFVFYFNGHGDTTVVGNNIKYNLVLNNGELFSSDKLIRQLGSLPESSPKIVILSTCFSGFFAPDLKESKLKNTTLLFAGPEEVPDGVYSKYLNKILSEHVSEDFSLQDLITSLKFNGDLQKMSAGSYQTKDCTNPFIFKKGQEPQNTAIVAPSLKQKRVFYGEALLPFHFLGKNGTAWSEKSTQERLSIGAEALFLATSITSGIMANNAYNKGIQQKQESADIQSYYESGRIWSTCFYASLALLGGSWIWHTFTVNHDIKQKSKLTVSFIPQVSEQYASIGVNITF